MNETSTLTERKKALLYDIGEALADMPEADLEKFRIVILGAKVASIGLQDEGQQKKDATTAQTA